MSRRRADRRPRPALKLHVEPLEARWLLNADGRRPRPEHAAASMALEPLRDARTDAGTFAEELARHPRLADARGLGVLAGALRRHEGEAHRDGWAATLTRILDAHPHYAAAHHLTAGIVPALPATPAAPIAPATIATTTTTTAATPAPVAPTPTPTPPTAPPIVVRDPQSVAVGGYLDVTLPNLGQAGPALTYTITPQPLPANMTFNRQTGELTFAPAPGQSGTYDFSVAVTGGTRAESVVLPVTVTTPTVASTEVSGQVVDQNGRPLAGMPVSIGTATAVTDAEGDFTLAGIPADPDPISAGGSVGSAQGRLDLTAPVAQLLDHTVYAGANNVLPTPLILPMIDWSSPSSFSQASPAQPLVIANPAVPGLEIQAAANLSPGAVPMAGTVAVAQLSPALSAQHMPPGVSSGMLLLQVAGASLNGPIQLTLPNTDGYAPGAVLSLYLFNPITGGHDAVGRMVVSADGATMTTTAPLTSTTTTAAPLVVPSSSGRSITAGASPPDGQVTADVEPNNTVACIVDAPGAASGTQNTTCAGCQPPASSTAATPNNGQPPLTTNTVIKQDMVMDSDAGLVTGEYFLDHQLVSYQAQGQSIGIDLQYSSAQADPNPVVQYQFTTPTGGDSSTIRSITAQVSLAGVTQGSATTYDTQNGLGDGETYNIPLQVDASQLASGVYGYTMTVTENFGAAPNMTSITTYDSGNVNVVNAASDALGSGWSVGGLQSLSQLATDGPVLMTAGQQGTETFLPTYTEGQTSIQDLAVVDGTQSAQILANDGTGTYPAPSLPALGMQHPGSTDDTAIASASGDFNGDGKSDVAALGLSLLSILTNNGSGGFDDGAVYDLPSGYYAKGIVAGNFSGHANGVLDLAVLMAASGTNAYYVAEYTGQGNGTFATPVISAVGNGSSSGGADSIVAGDFNGDGRTDLAFVTDDGLADIMLATSGGSFAAATALALPSGHAAAAVTTIADIGNSSLDLVVEAANSNLIDPAGAFASLDLFSDNGSGSFTYTSTDQTVGHVATSAHGLVSGDFQGSGDGPELALPLAGDQTNAFLAIVPLSTSATWGNAQLDTLPLGGVIGIVAADLNGAGKPSIVLSVAGGDELAVFLADPDSNQLLPMQTLTSTASTGMNGTPSYLLAVAPFMGVAAQPTYRGPTSDPSTLVQNSNGTWTRSYPDGTVIQFDAAGQETSESDLDGNTFHYAYETSGPAAGALATITDPVGLVTTLAYDSSGHLSTITDPAGRVTTFTVDSADDLTAIDDPDGAITGYGYASNHEATSETDPNGSTATAQYNSFGQLTSETLFGGTATTSVDAAQSNGLLAPGGSGSVPLAHEGSVTDPDGHTTSIGFNWMSHPTGETDADGGSSSTSYNSKGFPVAETDPMGRTTTYTYDSQGDVTSITQPYPGRMPNPGQNGGTETIAYDDPYGIPTSITDFNGNTTTYMLDSHGDVLEEEQPGGIDQEWTYNSAGQPLTATDADGHTTTYTYNSLGRLTTIALPLAGSPTIKYTYDQAGDVTSVTDPTGDTTTYTYDAMGRVLTEQDPVAAAAGKETTFTYDKDGNLLTATDAMGRVTSYAYNARNELVSETDPMGRVTTYAYDATGNLTSATDPMGRVTKYTYDDENQLLTTTDPMGGITTDAYDADSELTSVTDPDGAVTTYGYDNLGRLSGVSEQTGVYSPYGGYGPIESVAAYTYDADGNQLTAVDGDNHTTSSVYNALDELTSVTNADGDTTRYTYDANGNVLTATDGLGHTTSYTYDAMGDVLTETQPSGGGTTTDTYDADGDLLSLTDPDGNVTRYTDTADHQVATETLPTGGVYTYTYDLDNELTQVVDPDGHTIDYAYDADGEETSETWVNPNHGTPLDVFDYTYDKDGELTAVSDNNASYQYTYNADGEVTSQGDAGSTGLPSVTLDYGYDKNGNRTSQTDSLGGVTSYTYDARDEVTSLTFSGTGITPEAVAFTYDNAGNMTGLTRYSNLAETTKVAATSYTYDNAEQMTGITDKNSGGTTLVWYGYTYDAAGRVTQEARTWASGASSDTLTYGYTNNNQLTSVTHTNTSFASESFSWDANGNQTGTGYTTTTGNEQTASPGYTYTYDADGNMLTSTQTSTGDVWTYSYDYRNRMTGAVEKDSSGTILAQATYTYDPLDNRIGMDENGTQTWTLYDTSTQVAKRTGSSAALSGAVHPVMDFAGSGSLAMRYLNGPEGAIDTVLSRQSASGTVAWYLPDRLGTIRDMISNSGSIIDHVDYSAFGTQLDESSPSNGDRMMGYAGLERDTVTGMNLAVNRVQSPVTRRWTSPDPIGFQAGDPNTYRDVSNAPTIYFDPSGLSVGSITGNFLTGVAVGAVGALLIGGVVIAAGTVLPVAVISGGMLVVGGLGAYGWGMDVRNNWQCGDWDGLAYNAGSMLGGLGAGWGLGGRMPGAVKQTRPNLAREFELRYQWRMAGGSFGKMMNSGGTHTSYAVCMASGSAAGRSGWRRILGKLGELKATFW